MIRADFNSQLSKISRKSSESFNIFDVIQICDNIGVLLLPEGLDKRTVLRRKSREIAHSFGDVVYTMEGRNVIVGASNVRRLDKKLRRDYVI
ncbi:hypothetical protein LTR74_018836, partial [Friedmanniomyces endolithicus]